MSGSSAVPASASGIIAAAGELTSDLGYRWRRAHWKRQAFRRTKEIDPIVVLAPPRRI